MSGSLLLNSGPSAGISRFLIPDLPAAIDVMPFLRRIDEARWYSNFGPLVCEFEENLKQLATRADRTPESGEVHLTTLVSGHHALEAGLLLVGITRGKTVLLPAVTFTACPLAVQHAGGEAILSDIDPKTWTLTPAIARAVASRVKIDAVMPVALYGVPLPVSPWDEFTRETGIPVVIDAAAAVEVQQIPRYGLVAHSLHATKPFGIGEGGLLVSRDANFIEKARRYTNFGTRDRVCHMNGGNAKMSEYHAAVGLAQLTRWSRIKETRSQLFRLYRRHLEPFSEVLSLQPEIERAVVSLFVVMLERPCASIVLENFAKLGVAAHRSYFPPLYRHPYFESITVSNVNGDVLDATSTPDAKQAHMVNSEDMFARVVGVPFHSFMTGDDVIVVAREIGRQLCER